MSKETPGLEFKDGEFYKEGRSEMQFSVGDMAGKFKCSNCNFWRNWFLIMLCTSLIFAGLATWHKVQMIDLRAQAVDRACASYNGLTGEWGWIVEIVYGKDK